MDRPSAGKGSILIVDDDVSFRGLVASILKSRGYRVVEASNSDEASALFNDRDTKLAIIDYRMPGDDGMTWIQKLRDSGRATPVVFVSGNFCDATTFNRLRNILRVSLILKKPIIPAVFIEQIESLLTPEARQSLQDDGVADLRSDLGKISQTHSAISQVKRHAQSRSRLEIKEALKIAQANYIKDLSKEWNLLLMDCHHFKQEPARTDLLNEAMNIAHKIKGTAGSLNLMHIGDIASKLEHLLRVIDPAESTETEVIWSEIFRILAQGEAEVRAVSGYEEDTKVEAQSKEKLLMLSSRAEDAHWTSPAAALVDARSVAEASQKIKSTSFDAAIFDSSFESSGNLHNLARELRATMDGTIPIALMQMPGAPINFAGGLPPEDTLFLGASETFMAPNSTVDMDFIIQRLISLRVAQKQRILLCDDDPVLCNFVNSVLSANGFHVRIINDPMQVMDAIEEFKPDLLLLDVIMPGMTGYEVCRMIRETPATRALPIIFLTGKSSAESRAAAFQAGGDDFLTKPVLIDELLARLTGQLAKTNRSKQKLDIDQTTGLYNETSFISAAQQFFIQSAGTGQVISIGLMAIDDVDQVRMVHGIEALREAVAAIGVELRLRFRAEDIRGRIGYDAFAIITPGYEKGVLAKSIEYLQQSLAGNVYYGERGNFTTSFSAGVADTSEGETTLKGLIKSAYGRMVAGRQSASGLVTVSA